MCTLQINEPFLNFPLQAFIGQPDAPAHPELEETSALTYAVQLVRPACVKVSGVTQ